eukprot:2839826-Karenia_brevis.AAC.1
MSKGKNTAIINPGTARTQNSHAGDKCKKRAQESRRLPAHGHWNDGHNTNQQTRTCIHIPANVVKFGSGPTCE